MPTHFVSADVESRSLIAKKAVWNGLEFIVRFKAYGSFVRRFGRYVREGADLGGLVEITLKDDERGDPVIEDEAVAALGLLSLEQVREAKALARRAAEVIRDDLAEKGLELLDIKFECGIVDGRLVIIDDISTDNMRVVRDGKPVDARGLPRWSGGRSASRPPEPGPGFSGRAPDHFLDHSLGHSRDLEVCIRLICAQT